MSSRQLNDWLSAYIEYTDDTEPPLSYNVWTGISLIAATLERRVHIKWGFEKIYANMYIVLIGPSGKCRKGTAMGVGKDIIKDVGIQLTSESVTREALIRSMQRAIMDYVNPDTKAIEFHCALTAISPELSVFLGQNDVKFLADLTDWYDSVDKWTYETKGAGTDEIKGVCFNLLGATAPDWLQSILPEEAIGGGFTSRIIFVVEENKRKTVPEPIVTDRISELRIALKSDLERMKLMAGEFLMTEETRSIYSAWYQQQDDNIRNGKPPLEDSRFAGYCERRATHVRKLSMIFSASRGGDLLIQADDFSRALIALETVEKKMTKVFSGLGSAPYAKITEKLLTFFKQKKKVSRSETLRQFHRELDMPMLETIEKTLAYMKVIKIKIVPEEMEAYYTWIR